MTKPDFTTPITTLDAGKAWIKALHDADLMFHFEGSPDQIINLGTGEPIFTEEEAVLVGDRINELYALDWALAGHECPIGYALEVGDEDFAPSLAKMDEEYAAMISVHKLPDIGVEALLKTDLGKRERYWAETYLRRRAAVVEMAANYEPPASALDDGRDFTHPYEP